MRCDAIDVRVSTRHPPSRPNTRSTSLRSLNSLVARTQADERVRAALSALSDDQMRVVEMSFYEEKAHAEIAEILEIPLGTVKSRLRLAMARLRNVLDDPS